MSVDAIAFLQASRLPFRDSPEYDVMSDQLVRYAETNFGVEVKTATGYAAQAMSSEGAAAWIVWTLLDPPVVAVRAGLRHGEAVWHLARLVIRLSGSPSPILEPGTVAVISSLSVPSQGWPRDQSEEAATDRLASGLLRSFGMRSWSARRYARRTVHR